MSNSTHSTRTTRIYYTPQMEDADHARNDRIKMNHLKMLRMIGQASLRQMEQNVQKRLHRQERQEHVQTVKVPLNQKFAEAPHAA